MRYLGNKESIVPEIQALLEDKGIFQNGLSLFDAFCGSGSVSDCFKEKYNIIINDNLSWSVIYTHGRICASSCSFSLLGFDPFEYLNGNDCRMERFIYKTYAPTETQRMYFTPENAGRIDYFRWQIEEWKQSDKLTDDEYCYLLACLIESVSDVSNTAGVYGAFLKKWDSRALKPILFNKVDFLNVPHRSLKSYNAKIENIIADVECDILYLDPPYTQNQYGTQYHLLETLVLDDNPPVSKVTGSRSTSPMRSDWSKEYKANILFDLLVAKTQAKYIILSYNNDGLMSKKYIEATLKRYGKPETYVCRKISYKKYQNWKSQNEKPHFEYLFFVEKKPASEVYYEAPLNYIGNKSKVISNIIRYQPVDFDRFIDTFGGGFNVGINISAPNVVYNDINHIVMGIIRSLKECNTYEYLLYMNRVIKKFGLEKSNAEAYNSARNYYNSLPTEKRDPRLLLTIILYGFQQQIRFNGQHDFNNPVGMRWFNDKVLEKMISFSRKIKEGKHEFLSCDYSELRDEITPSTFVYFDPPYTLTTGAYNDGKRGFNGWNDKLESDLFAFADELNNKGIHFMLSYVVEHKGKTNKNLLDWIQKQGYTLIHLDDIVGISGSRRKEVLIINYAIQK
ncbi:MAG: DNA adenine methylase [Eubacteriales bacterium]|nr:DNA adenine methylase [Eubacteriales bacterium]MDD4512970.1 DNA adenine methylase [Eubacteriales bacterium]